MRSHFVRPASARRCLYSTLLALGATTLAACGGGSTPADDWVGTRQVGVAGAAVFANAVATDAHGNVYLAGYTTAGLDGNTQAGSHDAYLIKYGADGTRQYTRQLGVAGGQIIGAAVAVDAAGNVYLAGSAESRGLDGNTALGYVDCFLTKYDRDGVKQYTRELGASGATTGCNAVAADAAGNVYLTGHTSGGLDGGAPTGSNDLFVVKYDSTGVKRYVRQIGAAGVETAGNGIAVDASGNVYAVGYTQGGLDGNTLAGVFDVVLVKYDSGGTRQYTRQLGIAGSAANANAVATDTLGNVYVVGESYGNLGGAPLNGLRDLFLLKFDATGAQAYARQIGATGADTRGFSVATDAANAVYAVGYATAGVDGNTLTGGTDALLVKFDVNGTRRYTRQLGVASVQTRGSAVAVDARGSAFVAGHTYGGLDGNVLAGNTDAFVAKYSSAGLKQ